MKYSALISAIALILVGCSSGTADNQSDQIKNMTGGQAVGETSSLYWYTEKTELPDSASDYVTSGKYGWYQSDYQWRDRKLKEVIREGELLLKGGNEFASYSAHLRFNDDEEAVYQRYRIDGKVLPMTPEQIANIQREARALQVIVSEQDSKNQKLFQGYWDGEKLKTCDGKKYDSVEFNLTLPTFVINRLSNLDSYVAFIGKEGRQGQMTVIDILLLEDDGFDCVEPVSLIEE